MEPLQAQRIVFFSHWNNGDVYLTRPLVRFLMKALPGRKFSYAHTCAPDMLADIDGLEYDPSPLARLPNQPRWGIDAPSSTVYINMWVGQIGTYYVFLPQFGGSHSIALVQYVFAEQMRDLFYLDAPPVTQCIPVVDYKRFFIGEIDKFVAQDRRRKILISNGKVLSGQAQNFDFTPIVDHLSRKFPDLLFIPTAPMNLPRPNVIQSADIIKKGRPDLNETGYLSMFCDVIVGRSSGPYTFSVNPHNLSLPKKFVCFCNRQGEATYGLDDPIFNAKCSFTYSNNYDPASMIRIIEQSLESAESTRISGLPPASTLEAARE
jgi:hypothetical protein